MAKILAITSEVENYFKQFPNNYSTRAFGDHYLTLHNTFRWSFLTSFPLRARGMIVKIF